MRKKNSTYYKRHTPTKHFHRCFEEVWEKLYVGQCYATALSIF